MTSSCHCGRYFQTVGTWAPEWPTLKIVWTALMFWKLLLVTTWSARESKYTVYPHTIYNLHRDGVVHVLLYIFFVFFSSISSSSSSSSCSGSNISKYIKHLQLIIPTISTCTASVAARKSRGLSSWLPLCMIMVSVPGRFALLIYPYCSGLLYWY